MKQINKAVRSFFIGNREEIIRNNRVCDYHDFTTIDTPKEERRKNNIGNVWINAVICNLCNEEIRSRNRHDVVSCSCGNVSVDGGSWYAKRNYKTKDSYTDVIISFNDIDKEIE